MSVAELAQALNKTAMFQVHGLSVEVKIVDVRKVFDRIDYLVHPVAGDGQSWVSSSCLRIL